MTFKRIASPRHLIVTVGLLFCGFVARATDYNYTVRYGGGEGVAIGYTFSSASLGNTITSLTDQNGADYRTSCRYYLWNRSTLNWDIYYYDDLANDYIPSDPTLHPGDVLIIRNYGSGEASITLSGTIYSSSVTLSVPANSGSWFPVSTSGGTLAGMGFPSPADGDQNEIMETGASGQYFDVFTYDASTSEWVPYAPSYTKGNSTGDAFYYYNNSSTSKSWTVSF